MRVYKPIYKDRNGQKQKTAAWYVDIFDHNRLRHKIPAFADKRLSEALGRNIEALINCRIAGLEPDVRLNQWIETLPDSLLKKFVSWGLIEGQRAEITKPLKEHIDDYIKILEAKGYSKDYTTRSKNRLKKITSDCRFTYFRDITQSAVEIYSGKLKKDEYSNTSRAHYLDALKTFLNWAETDQRIIRNPISKMGKPARDSEKKGILTPEQFVRLIQTTIEKNIIIQTTTGVDRGILYFLAGVTGLRRRELLLLVWDDLHLAGESPYILARAATTKNAQEARQPIPSTLARLLEGVQGQRKPQGTGRLFEGFAMSINTAMLIREDLAVAKIKPKDKDGNEICFHRLRNSYISFLANGGAPAKIVQKLARHSDPRLTFNTYARAFEETEQEAIALLPNVGNFVLSTCLDKNWIRQEICIDNQRQKNSQDTAKTAFLADRKLRLGGRLSNCFICPTN